MNPMGKGGFTSQTAKVAQAKGQIGKPSAQKDRVRWFRKLGVPLVIGEQIYQAGRRRGARERAEKGTR